jgi:hypothetical protein
MVRRRYLAPAYAQFGAPAVTHATIGIFLVVKYTSTWGKFVYIMLSGTDEFVFQNHCILVL